MPQDPSIEKIRAAIDVERMVDTAVRLIEVPSPTRSAGAAADRLAGILDADGFAVERPDGGWPQAAAVVTRWPRQSSGPTLQFDGHLDTVHLPFVPPRVADGVLTGSGASDMKGGIAAMVEALRTLRDAGALETGSVLLSAHDLHEAPWGDGSQLDALIDAGFVGDGALVPEYLSDRLPLAGRGHAVIEATVRRDGEPVHEVLGGRDQPDVIRAGAELVRRLCDLDGALRAPVHAIAGSASVFVGSVHAGEIYNQAPIRLDLAGSRRWLPGTPPEEVKSQYLQLLADVAAATGTRIDGRFTMSRDAFEMDPAHPLIDAFQSVCRDVTGAELQVGPKLFVDDGNTFVSRAGIPAITHGPAGTGAHTTDERVPVDELVRVALVYALTAVRFCGA